MSLHGDLMLYPPGFIVVLSRLGNECLHCVSTVHVNYERECPMTAPPLGESCDLWCERASVWRKPASGSKTLEEDVDCHQDERPSQPLQVDGGRASVQ